MAKQSMTRTPDAIAILAAGDSEYYIPAPRGTAPTRVRTYTDLRAISPTTPPVLVPGDVVGPVTPYAVVDTCTAPTTHPVYAARYRVPLHPRIPG